MPLRTFSALRRRPFFAAGVLLALAWLWYVGAALYARLALPQINRTRSVLASLYGQTTLLQANPDGTFRTQTKRIGPITTWKNGLVYWDETKQCFFLMLPGKKTRAIWPKPTLPPNDGTFSLMPAPNAVYVNLIGGSRSQVVRVRLSDGQSHPMPKIQAIRSSDQNEAYAGILPNGDLVVYYANGKTRIIPANRARLLWGWDYDADRDAVAWFDDAGIHYDSPARTWHCAKPIFSHYSIIDFGGGSDGDVWAYRSGALEEAGTRVFTADEVERGSRLRGELINLQHFLELSPEQASLFSNLPDHK